MSNNIHSSFITEFSANASSYGSSNSFSLATVNFKLNPPVPNLNFYVNPQIDLILTNISKMSTTTIKNTISVISVNISQSLSAFDQSTSVPAGTRLNSLISQINSVLSTVTTPTLTSSQATAISGYLSQIETIFSTLMSDGIFKDGFSGKSLPSCGNNGTSVKRGRSDNQHWMNNISLLNSIVNINNLNMQNLAESVKVIATNLEYTRPSYVGFTTSGGATNITFPSIPNVVNGTNLVSTSETPIIGTEIELIDPIQQPITFPSRVNPQRRRITTTSQSSTPQQLAVEQTILSLENQLNSRAETFAELVKNGSISSAQIEEFNKESKAIENQITSLRRTLTSLLNSDPVRNRNNGPFGNFFSAPLIGVGQTIGDAPGSNILSIFNSPKNTEGLQPWQKEQIRNSLTGKVIKNPIIPQDFLTMYEGFLSKLNIRTTYNNTFPTPPPNPPAPPNPLPIPPINQQTIDLYANNNIDVHYTGALNDKSFSGTFSVNLYALSYLPIEAYNYLRNEPNALKLSIVTKYGITPSSETISDQELWNAIIIFLFSYLSIMCYIYTDSCNSLNIYLPNGILPNILYSMKSKILSTISNGSIPSSAIILPSDTRQILSLSSSRLFSYYMYKRTNSISYFDSINSISSINSTLANSTIKSFYMEPHLIAPHPNSNFPYTITSITPSGTQPLDMELTITGTGFDRNIIVVLTLNLNNLVTGTATNNEIIVIYPQPYNITETSIKINPYFDSSKIPTVDIPYFLTLTDSVLTKKAVTYSSTLTFSIPVFPNPPSSTW